MGISRELDLTLKCKAEKEDTVNLHDIKANKEDLESSLRNIDILHK